MNGMSRIYSLAEIKAELCSEIEKLEALDPFWKRCRNCPFKGRCCIDNDIDIREDEWFEIKALLDSSETIKAQVRDNFLHHRKCFFQTEKCCLIHPIRPCNCLYTPYQAVLTDYEHHLIFNVMDEKCEFETKEILYHPMDVKEPIIWIPGQEHPYLFLNYWVSKFGKETIDSYEMSGEERLREYFAQDCSS